MERDYRPHELSEKTRLVSAAREDGQPSASQQQQQQQQQPPPLYDDGSSAANNTTTTMFISEQAAATDMLVQVGRCTAKADGSKGSGQLDTVLLESTAAVEQYLLKLLQDDHKEGVPSNINTTTAAAARNHDNDNSNAAASPPPPPTITPAGLFFLIDPTFGWGRLQITRAAMTKIARQYDVFPAFWKLLSVFGEKSFARDEGYGAYVAMAHPCSGKNSSEGADIAFLESCFLWKYVEPGGAEGRYTYSIRQGLIYQKFNVKTKQSTNILIRVPRKLAAQMKASLTSIGNEAGEKSPHHDLLDEWTGLQMMCAASGLDEWRNFINYLDQQVSQLFDDFILAGTNVATAEKADELQYRLTSMKRLQFFVDQILRAGHMLDVNKITISTMIRAFLRQKDTIRGALKLTHRLEDLQQEYEYLAKMARNVLDRAIMLSHELRDTIALRNHEINKTSNDSAATATHAIVELSRKSAYEARVVKLLSVVAVIFLPASFAADFLQMGYLFVTEEGRFRVHATADLWLYAMFTIPLLIVTVSLYVVFEMLSRRKSKRQADLTRKSDGRYGKLYV